MSVLQKISDNLGGVGATTSLAYTLHMPSLNEDEHAVLADHYQDVFEALEPLHSAMLDIDIYIRRQIQELLYKRIVTPDKSSFMRENLGKTIKTIYTLVRQLSPAKLQTVDVENGNRRFKYTTSDVAFINITSLIGNYKSFGHLQSFCKKLKPHEKTLQLLKTLLLPSHDNDTILQIHASDATVDRKQSDELAKVLLLAITRSLYTTAFCDGVLRSESAKGLQHLGTLATDAVNHIYHTIYTAYEKYTVVVGCKSNVSESDNLKRFREDGAGVLVGEGIPPGTKKEYYELDNKQYRYHSPSYTIPQMKVRECEVGVGLGLSEMAIIGTHEDLLVNHKDNYAVTPTITFASTIGIGEYARSIVTELPQNHFLTVLDFQRLIFTGSLNFQGKLYIRDFREEILSAKNYRAYKSMVFRNELPLFLNLSQSRRQNRLERYVKGIQPGMLPEDRLCNAAAIQELTGILEEEDNIFHLKRLRGLFRLSTDELNDGGVQYCRGSESFTLDLTLNVVNISLSGMIDPLIFAKRGNIFGSAATDRYAAQLNAANEETFRLRKVKTEAEKKKIAVIIGATVAAVLGLFVIIGIIVAIFVTVRKRQHGQESTSDASKKSSTTSPTKDPKKSMFKSSHNFFTKKASSQYLFNQPSSEVPANYAQNEPTNGDSQIPIKQPSTAKAFKESQYLFNKNTFKMKQTDAMKLPVTQSSKVATQKESSKVTKQSQYVFNKDSTKQPLKESTKLPTKQPPKSTTNGNPTKGPIKKEIPKVSNKAAFKQSKYLFNKNSSKMPAKITKSVKESSKMPTKITKSVKESSKMPTKITKSVKESSKMPTKITKSVKESSKLPTKITKSVKESSKMPTKITKSLKESSKVPTKLSSKLSTKKSKDMSKKLTKESKVSSKVFTKKPFKESHYVFNKNSSKLPSKKSFKGSSKVRGKLSVTKTKPNLEPQSNTGKQSKK